MGEPPASSLAFLVMTAGRRIRDEVEERLRADGLTLRHVSALGHLRARPGMSASELARRAGVTVQSMQATLDGLAELGAVERQGGGQGRALRITVTSRGDEIVATGTRAVAAADAALAAALPPAARQDLAAALAAFLGRPQERDGSRPRP